MKKPVIVVHINKPMGGVTASALIKMSEPIFRKYKDSHDFILIMPHVKTNAGAITFIQNTGITPIQIITTGRLAPLEVFNKAHSSWREFIKNSTWFDLHDHKIDKIYVLGGMLSKSINREKNDAYAKMLGRQSYMNFMSIGGLIAPLLQLVKLAIQSEADVIEIIYDPQECQLKYAFEDGFRPRSYEALFVYNIPAYGLKHEPLLCNPTLNIEPREKTIDFVFGGSFVTPDRHAIYEKVNRVIDRLPGFKEVYVKHNMLDVNTSIPYDEYLSKIASARHTLIIPAYDTNTFSAMRFIESIKLNCLPYIMSSVRIDEFFATYDIDTKAIEDIIIDDVGFSPINQIMPERSEQILKYIQNRILTFHA